MSLAGSRAGMCLGVTVRHHFRPCRPPKRFGLARRLEAISHRHVPMAVDGARGHGRILARAELKTRPCPEM